MAMLRDEPLFLRFASNRPRDALHVGAGSWGITLGREVVSGQPFDRHAEQVLPEHERAYGL